ncbi:MAG: hypothetical protein ACTSRL_17685 [Candidatus Helarchaeota archaeon]
MTQRDRYGERINPRVYTGSKIVGYLYLILAVILVVQSIISILNIYGVISIMPFAELLSGPSYIVQAFEGLFLMIAVMEMAFAAIGLICFIGILREQEWAAGISLVLMGLIALTMLMHLILTPALGALNIVLEAITFGIAILSSVYVMKNFKRFD